MNSMRQSLLQVIKDAVQPVIDECFSEPTLQKQGQQCANQFVRLMQAVEVRDALDSNQSVSAELAKSVSVTKISKLQLFTCDEMLEAQLLDNESLTLKSLLIQIGKLQDVERALKKTFLDDYRLSTITAEKLCELAVSGDLDAIKKESISSFRVNQLVSWAVTSGPATYLGHYNALMLAVAHRQVDVVNHFLQMSGVNLTIKGGRDSKVTARDCANKLSLLFPDVNQDVVKCLDKKLSVKPIGNYYGAFLKSRATDTTSVPSTSSVSTPSV